MVWAGIRSRGKTALRFVEPGVKINTDYYINKTLKSFLLRDVPRLFQNNMKKKMVFHRDNAPSHVLKKNSCFFGCVKN